MTGLRASTLFSEFVTNYNALMDNMIEATKLVGTGNTTKIKALEISSIAIENNLKDLQKQISAKLEAQEKELAELRSDLAKREEEDYLHKF